MTKKLLMGNEAMAHAALEAGVRIVAGYPGTPSSEIVETVARLHADGTAHGVHVEWSTNEKVALELLFGASLAGARGLFTCKQMGLNVASDALMSLNYVSVRGGLVLIVADDPGPISSQTEQDTRRFAAFAKVPVLDPATPEQAFEMVKAAFELSERFHTPVIVRPTTRVDHASAFFDVQDETEALPLPDERFERNVAKWVIFPKRAYEAHGEINERLVKIAHAFSTEETFAPFNEIEEADGAALGIVAGGVSAAYTREALDLVQKRAQAAGIAMPVCRFMQIGTPYPFPDEAIMSFARGLTDVLVVEELDHVLEDELARWAGRTHTFLNIHGKLTGAARDRGENDVDDIAERIERFVGLHGRLKLRRSAEAGNYAAVELPADSLPIRPPVLCAGCPHRGAFYAVKKALGKTPAVMCGDIGCYTLGNAKPLETVDTCLCMGAGITMAQGLSVVDPGKKAIAFVGDSTLFASGMTGLANAAYNGHNITVMVLDNATTAMTGSQPHPGTGATLMGKRNAPLAIESVLAANGFLRVYRANPLDKDSSIVAVKAALAYEGPSAVLFKSPCIQLTKPDAPVVINTERCTGCKKCITEIGCPAIGFDASATGMRSGDRGQACIDTSLCNGCTLCTQVCPFKAIAVMPPTKTSSSADGKDAGAPRHARAILSQQGETETPELSEEAAQELEETAAVEPEEATTPEPFDEKVEVGEVEAEELEEPEALEPDEPEETQVAEEAPEAEDEEDLLSASETVAFAPIEPEDEPETRENDEAPEPAEDDESLPLDEEITFIPLENGALWAGKSSAAEPDEDDEALSASETVAFAPIVDEALPADVTVAFEPIADDALSASETVAFPPIEEDTSSLDKELSEDDALSASKTIALPPIEVETPQPEEEAPSPEEPTLSEDDVLSASETVAFPPIEEDALSASETVAFSPIASDSSNEQDQRDPFEPASEGDQDA